MVNSQRFIYLAALIHPKQSLGKPATRKMVGGRPFLKRLVLRLPGRPQTTENEPLPSPTHCPDFISSMALGLQQEHKTELGCLLNNPTDATVAAPRGSTQYSGPPKKSRTQDALSLDLFPSSADTSWTLWMGSLGVHRPVGELHSQ